PVSRAVTRLDKQLVSPSAINCFVLGLHLSPKTNVTSLLILLPIHYKVELHDVRLLNFSVAMDDVLDMVPANMKLRDFVGRAMISMVDVKLKNMRPVAFPFVRFNYRHVAFRLLVDDSARNGGSNKGIFFFRSFTNKPLIVFGGKLMTDYNLEDAN